jgi:U3 small nucleolar RNA-associated protein 22
MGNFSSRPVDEVGKVHELKVPADTRQGSKQKGRRAVVLNESAVLSEIARLGHGIIKSITVHT